MIVIIHYNGQYEDSIKIEGNTIKELKKVAYEEINRRDWEEKYCWSEVLDKTESEDEDD